MNAKITLSFDEKIIEKAKEFAAQQNISLSRLTEDKSDFYFSELPVLNSQEFVRKYFG